MSLTIDIPDWAAERRVFIFLGVECWMVYEPEERQWYKKTVHCNRCGKCCQGPYLDSWPHGVQVIDGVEYCGGVRYSGGEWICQAISAPFGCSRDLPNKLPHPDCVMRYEKVNTKTS